MKSVYIWVLGIALVLLGGGWYWYQQGVGSSSNEAEQELGWRYAGVFQDSAVNVTTLKLPDGRFVAYYSSGQPGTGRKTPKRAFSDDGLTWTPDESWTCPDLCDQPDGLPSLPHRDHLTLKDGRFRTYVSSKDGIVSFISTDGLSWTKEAGVRLAKDSSIEWEQGSGALVDWSAIYLPDGKVRAYYQGQRKAAAGKDCGDCYVVASAISSDDGLTFAREPGLRLDPLALDHTFSYGGYGFSDAQVVAVDEGYRAFFGDYAGPIASATSTDGLTFTFDGPLPLWGANPSVTMLDDGRLLVLAGQGQGPDSTVCPGKAKCPENYNLEHMLVWEPVPVSFTVGLWDNAFERATVEVNGKAGEPVDLKIVEGTGMSCKFDFDKQMNIWKPGCYFDPSIYSFKPASGTVPFTTTLRRATDPSLVRTEHTVLFTGTVAGEAVAGAVRCIHRAFSGDPNCPTSASTGSNSSVESTPSTPPAASSGTRLTVSTPQNNATVSAETFEVMGTTKVGYEVRIYLDQTGDITAETKAVATAKADDLGSFAIKPAKLGLTAGKHTLRVATLPVGSSTIDPASITEVVFSLR